MAPERRGVREQRRRHFHSEDLRARVERDPEVALTAHVHTHRAGHGGEGTREQVGRALSVDGRFAIAERNEPRFVEEQHETGIGKPLRNQMLERACPRA